MKNWKFAIVGAGSIAAFHAKAIADMRNATLVAVCDVDASKAMTFGQQFDCHAYSSLDEMFNKEQVDIITIATPSGLHMAPAIAAADRHIHTIVEKPLEITVERIQAMIAAHKKSGTQLGCIFQTRYAKSLEPLRNAINDGRFGTITFAGVYVPWWRTDGYYKDSWHGTWKLDGGGALMNQSIHMIDTLCELMPPIESVQAFTNSIGHPGIESEDTAVAALRFSNGALGAIYGSTAAYPGQPKRLEIMGTKGTVVYIEDSYSVFDFADKSEADAKVLSNFGQMSYKSGFSDPKAIVHSLHTACFEDFVNCIDNSTPFKISGEEALKSVQLIRAIYDSSQKSALVKL